ncbi:6-phosphofructokinase [Gregarina niphandrodes]|uniref:Probable ATP-dependent 6-phosphofructokinase n=1 Tax=Gregarina niphandrodes TaxID=110365 RepID=A0A023B5V9_GRENI|nr:6-phosphofructokinase [Gregarina niphandrodes]EZG62792.1 6-phosphofructokinase [Gregarina niphandrodes]|eukprot:XP_011130713.1 6-phosphofructokinase [Gregarina niphandrodes]
MAKRRVHTHLQSADLFAYFSPVQKERQKMTPVTCDALCSGGPTVLQELEIEGLEQLDGTELSRSFPNIYGQPVVSIEQDMSSDSSSGALVHPEALITETPPMTVGPMTVGLVLSGGPAPGGHNVIAGVYDYIKRVNPASRMVGFKGGLDGLFNNEHIEVTDELMDRSRNSGGFDMFWSGRGMVTEKQKPLALQAVTTLALNGLIVVGGDGSNSNAALLAEYFAAHKSNTNVIGVPKTIDGDLKNAAVECSFGFDTAAKTYSELIGNLCTDCSSGQGVWHFVRVMGRSASHLVLECAMQTRPNLVFIGEEVEAKNISLKEIVDDIVELVLERRAVKKDYGIVLVPEGLIGFIPEMKLLIAEMSEQLCKGQQFDEGCLSQASQDLWHFLPSQIQQQLLTDREASGYVQVAKIATERLLILLVEEGLRARGIDIKTWNRMHHYFGYEGRCAMPSNFDANYCYNLGMTAGCLIHHRKNGYMAIVKDLVQEASLWTAAGVPFTKVMRMLDLPLGRVPGVIRQLVDVKSPAFRVFESVRPDWRLGDYYRSPGPIQFLGPCADVSNCVVAVPSREDLLAGRIPELQHYSGLGRADTPKRFGCYSQLQQLRILWRPPIPDICHDPWASCSKATQYLPKDPYIRRQTLSYCPRLCKENEFHLQEIKCSISPAQASSTQVRRRRVGVAFLSRQSPGLHNIVWGMRERLKLTGGTLLGFKRGAEGLLADQWIEVTDEDVQPFRNLGGADLLGRGTTHMLLDPTNRRRVLDVCRANALDGLVLVGSSLAMTETAYLAEYFLTKGSRCCVVGVPATASNNLAHELMETNIGFDTASKLYSSLIGNVLTDAASMPKYWHFVRLMGRQPSNEVLECALQTHPNCVVIAEEYGAAQKTLDDVVKDIADVVCERARATPTPRNFGAVLIPDGLWHHLPTMKLLLQDLDRVMVAASAAGEQLQAEQELLDMANFAEEVNSADAPTTAGSLESTPKSRSPALLESPASASRLLEVGRSESALPEIGRTESARTDGGVTRAETVRATPPKTRKWSQKIAPWSAAVWRSLPAYIRREFLTTDYELRDSFVETEVLLSQLVRAELERRKTRGEYVGTFQCVCHYFGYQGRSAMPSNFDATLGLVHGYLAAICVESAITGHLTTVRGLTGDVKDWKLGAIPFNCLLTLVPSQQNDAVHPQLSTAYTQEQLPILPNAETDLNSKALRWLMVARASWSKQDRFCNPGPIQFWGTASKFYHRILHEEQADYSRMLRHVQKYAEILRDACSFGVDEEFLKFAYSSLHGLLALRFYGDHLLTNLAPPTHNALPLYPDEDSTDENEPQIEHKRIATRLPSKSDWKRSFIGF